MQKSKNFIGIISIILILAISILIFYAILIPPNKFNDLIFLGIISIIFSIISYLLHSIFKNKKIVSSFVWGYYFLGIVSLLLASTIIKYNLSYIIVILFFILLSLVFIYWRIKSLGS